MDQKHNRIVLDDRSEDPVIKIFLDAIKNRASDVHIEPGRAYFEVRYRVDGLMQPAFRQSVEQQEELMSRLKVLSSQNITEHFLPQDGFMECDYGGRSYNIRVSTMPTAFGEAMVFRIHNREDILIEVKDLGFDNQQLETILRLISSRSGIILTTGPTGSGKTSLLYSLLHSINHPNRNILSIEDPIEYHLPNIRQSQISESLGSTYPVLMRSVVRQDPDIVMLGEIRDAETAQMAASASLIGTLIFSTFHTFDIPALIARLQELGVTRSIIAQSINGVISTRLLRKNCPNCLVLYEPNDAEKRIIGDVPYEVLKKGRGCDQCKNAGYRGRTGIYEIVVFDDDLKTAVIEDKPPSFIKEMLGKKQIKKLRTSAVEKVVQGSTTLEESLRVLGYPMLYQG